MEWLVFLFFLFLIWSFFTDESFRGMIFTQLLTYFLAFLPLILFSIYSKEKISEFGIVIFLIFGIFIAVIFNSKQAKSEIKKMIQKTLGILEGYIKKTVLIIQLHLKVYLKKINLNSLFSKERKDERIKVYKGQKAWLRLREHKRGKDFWKDLAFAIGECAESLPGFKNALYRVRETILRLRERKVVSVAIVGEFNSGKSTFINSVVGSDIAATANEECTTTPLRVGYSQKLIYSALKRDGQEVSLSPEKFNLISESDSKDYLEKRVSGPFELLKEVKIELVDTPGASSKNPELEKLTMEAIQTADVCLILMDSSQPGSKSFINFLEKVRAIQPRFFLALSRCDHRSVEELAEHREFSLPKLHKKLGIESKDILFLGKSPGQNYLTLNEGFKVIQERISAESEKIIEDRLLNVRNGLQKEISISLEEHRLEIIERTEDSYSKPTSFKMIWNNWAESAKRIDGSKYGKRFHQQFQSQFETIRTVGRKDLQSYFNKLIFFRKPEELSSIFQALNDKIKDCANTVAASVTKDFLSDFYKESKQILDYLKSIGFPQINISDLDKGEMEKALNLTISGPIDAKEIFLAISMSVTVRINKALEIESKRPKLIREGKGFFDIFRFFKGDEILLHWDSVINQIPNSITEKITAAFSSLPNEIERAFKLAEQNMEPKHLEIFLNEFDTENIVQGQMENTLGLLNELMSFLEERIDKSIPWKGVERRKKVRFSPGGPNPVDPNPVEPNLLSRIAVFTSIGFLVLFSYFYFYQESFKKCDEYNTKECFNLGFREYENGNIKKAKELYSLACNGGDLNGCNRLGVIHEENGNFSEASKLYTKACKAGDAGSCYALSKVKDKEGRNISETKKIEPKGCHDGEINECFNLGITEYESGNIEKAKELYTKACDGGQMRGCNALGVIEEEKESIEEAKNYYTKACDGGEMRGCYNLGLLEIDRKNITAAKKLFSKACDGGYEEGCSALKKKKKGCDGGDFKECYNLGAVEMEKGNITKAKKLYSKACDGGEMLACNSQGSIEKDLGNFPEAKNLYAKACDGGLLGGCYNLGIIEIKNGNFAEAKRLYAKACDGGFAGGCNNLALLEEEKGNITKAKKLYSKACDGGDMKGCANYAFLEVRRGNFTKAKELYSKSCNGGEMVGCLNVGLIEEKEGNFTEAIKLYSKVCNSGDQNACKALIALKEKLGNITSKGQEISSKGCDEGAIEDCIKQGQIEYKNGNSLEAKKLFSKACEGGDIRGCNGLGQIEEDKGNLEEAKIFYTEACNKSRVLGECTNSIRIDQVIEINKTKKIFSNACDKGDMRGCYNLGSMEADNGNITEAKRLFQMACKNGETAACYELDIIENKK